MESCGNAAVVSSIFSTISCGSWIFAQLPQIITNYKHKSAEGISPSFLLLWFMGDFLSFTSCLLNDVVLEFQVYLSLFFICNDITLCFQYYYYNSIYPRKNGRYFKVSEPESPVFPSQKPDVDYPPQGASAIHIRHPTVPTESSPSNSGGSSYNSTDDNTPGAHTPTRSSFTKSAMVTLLNSPSSFAMPTATLALTKRDSRETWGVVLAWACTVVYMSSRCPQLYKNYQRKSVTGISPMLFGAALMGNLGYTLSILTSCEFVYGESRADFFYKELPYILGSSGTIVFDAIYFYQKHIYRDAGINTSVIAMSDWNNH